MRYGIAVLAVALALGLQLLLDPLIMQETPFLFVFAAVMVSAWYGGLGPGLLATVLAALITDYFFLYPIDSFSGPSLEVTPLVVFVLEGALVSVLAAALRFARQRAEDHQEKLRRSEERFRLLVENSSDIIFDANGAVTYQSPSVERILGYKPEESIGKNVLESPLVHPDDLALMRDFFADVRDNPGIEVTAEFRLRHADGSWRYVEATGKNLLHDPSVRGIIATYRDITERKRAEEDLARRARQQAAVARLGVRALAEKNAQAITDEAVALVAQTLEVEYCEILELLPEGDELLLRAGVGWKEGLVGQATVGAGLDSQAGYTLLSEEPVIEEDLREEGRFSGPPLLHEHGVVSGISTIIQGRDGPFGVLGAHTRSRRTFTEDDVNFLQAVANVVATAVEREQAEEKLGEVREAERNRMARDLHDEALQDLTYTIAEAQFLQTISGDPQLGGRLERLVGTLKRAGQGLRGAVYDLRLGERGREQTFVELLESLVELERQRSPDAQMELSVEEGFAPPLSEAAEAELLRIVREALTNARRHSEARRIWIAAGASGDKLWAEVEDDGRGFDPKETSSGTGTKGMRERARSLGGELRIESKPGEGSRVRFELDLQRDGKGSEEEVRILLVEDHVSFRQGLAAVLEREPGFSVVGQAGSLSEARVVLSSSRGVDVALIDLGLPDGYGGELIKELRETNPQAQALVLSAGLDRSEMARAVESGAAGVLHKTVSMNEIAEATRRLGEGETLLPLEEVVELLRLAGTRREQEHQARRAVAQLTAREKEVLQALAEGLGSQQIAERLHISPQTERNHMTSILAKLGVHSRLQALVFAVRHGVVEIRRTPADSRAGKVT